MVIRFQTADRTPTGEWDMALGGWEYYSCGLLNRSNSANHRERKIYSPLWTQLAITALNQTRERVPPEFFNLVKCNRDQCNVTFCSDGHCFTLAMGPSRGVMAPWHFWIKHTICPIGLNKANGVITIPFMAQMTPWFSIPWLNFQLDMNNLINHAVAFAGRPKWRADRQ